jgi:putative peptidoglycan lipid II flippase
MIGRLSLWVLLYVATNQVALLTVIVLSSSVQGYAAYASAFILFQLPHAIFSVSVMTALLPAMSKKWTERDRPGFADLLGRGLRSTAFIILPAALGYIALARPITYVTLRHGATTASQADLVAQILVCFAVGLPFFSAFQLFARVFYGAQNTRATALINLVATAVNIVLNFVLFHAMGVKGLALAFSISYVVAAAFAFAALRWWLPTLDARAIAGSVARSGLAAVVSALVALGVSRAIGGPVAPTFGGQIVQVTAGVVAGAAAFLLVARTLRMPEIEVIQRVIPNLRRPRSRGRHRG